MNVTRALPPSSPTSSVPISALRIDNPLTHVCKKDDGTGPDYDLPAPTAAGAVGGTASRPESMIAPSLNEDHRWARDRTGWAPRFGQGDEKDNEGPTLLDHQTWIESKLDNKWYGGKTHIDFCMSCATLTIARLVLQCRRHRLRLSCDACRVGSRRRSRCRLHHHGGVWHLLPHLHPTGPPQL